LTENIEVDAKFYLTAELNEKERIGRIKIPIWNITSSKFSLNAVNFH